MKAVQINSSCGSGSTGKICAALSDIMDDDGIENYIFYSGFKKSSHKNGRLINSLTDIRVHQLLSRLFGNQGWYSKRTTRKLVAALEDIDPDIIHLHNLHGYYLNMDILFDYLSKNNKHVIWTLHDCWAFTGHCSHFTAVKCERWKKHCNDCPQKSSYPYSLFFDRSSGMFDRKQKLYGSVNDLTVTTVSKWLGEQVFGSALLGNREIRVIPNGINIDVFRPHDRLTSIQGIDITAKKVILGVASTWGPRKGLNDFLKLAKLLDSEYIIVLVGLSEEQIAILPENIVGIKRTDNVDQLVDLYSSADVFVNPSIEETFGLTNIEAMACGTPAIVYNSTACPEVVADMCGLVVEVGNVEKLKEGIISIAQQGKTRYSQKCQDYVATKYDERKIYKKYLKLYYEVNGEKK